MIVEWDDATTDSGWCPPGDVSCKPERVVSVGWVIKHTKTAITLAGDTDAKRPLRGDVNRTIVIPQGMVRDVHELSREVTS